MKSLGFKYDNALIFDRELSRLRKNLATEIDRMKKAHNLGYLDDRSSINLPFDKHLIAEVKKLAEAKKKSIKPDILVIIGMGGSSLGTMAIVEAMLGRNHNLDSEPKVIFTDNIDARQMQLTFEFLEKSLKQKKNILINVVSKSGKTTETIANFEILLSLVKKYNKNYKKHIVATTDRDSALWDFSKKEGISRLEVPKKVGGRYSVFSPVGLFPLAVLGIDIMQIAEGAAAMVRKCLKDSRDNPAAVSACIHFFHYINARNISSIFLFGSDLESIGKWYRQLVAESLGKEFNIKRKKVHYGITPIVSIGSTDLHSMAQLFLGGPYDKLHTLVSVKNPASLKVPRLSLKLVDNIEGKKLSDITDAIYKGFAHALKKDGRPFMEIFMPEENEFYIGQFLQLKMIEVMYLGHLMKVNAFSQPNVEDYKKKTRKILKK